MKSETEHGKDPQIVLKKLGDPLGMRTETAGFFGGGEENWTENKSCIYEVEIGAAYQVCASCNENNVINSVSIWLFDEERSAEQGAQRVRILTDFTQTKPVYDETASEAGSKNWKWISDEKSLI